MNEQSFSDAIDEAQTYLAERELSSFICCGDGIVRLRAQAFQRRTGWMNQS
jgi:hypothetical protein